MVVALNLYPYNNGHLLIIPKAHVPSIEVLPAEALTDLMLTVNKAIGALRSLYNPHPFTLGGSRHPGAVPSARGSALACRLQLYDGNCGNSRGARPAGKHLPRAA